MSHHAFQQTGASFEGEADYVVVGSGAGGAAAAVQLARHGEKVAIVEAGPWRDPEHYPMSVYGSMRDLMDDWGTLLTRGRTLWPVVQARCVGGTTVINSAIVVRTPADIFRLWEAEHGVGGDAMAEAVWAHQDALDGELNVEEVPPGSRGRSNELAMLGGERIGIEGHVIRRNAKACLGEGQCLQGCRSHRKQSTNLNFVPEVLSRGGQVVSCAPVKRILLEGTRAIGVAGRFRHPDGRKGDPFAVRARKAVLVAASATHSPALLLRSGVKSPALGEFFRAHPGTGVFGVYDEPVNMNVGATQGWASIHFREKPGLKLETLSLPLELVASRLSGAGTELLERLEEYPYLAMWVAAIRAEAVGRVSNGFGDKPVVRYSLRDPDMKRLVHGLHTLARMHVAAGARAVIPGIHGLPYKLAPSEIDQILEAPLDPKRYIAILSHLFGGCVMGSDPSRSVCDGRGRVHGYQGLVIADASGIPTTLGVNPQHTIMGLARLHADALLS